MFANAYKKATKFTHPVIISTHTLDGEVKCGCGAFVLLNNEGWILTVAHILNSHFVFQKHQEQLDRYRKEVEKIEDQVFNALPHKIDELESKFITGLIIAIVSFIVVQLLLRLLK